MSSLESYEMESWNLKQSEERGKNLPMNFTGQSAKIKNYCIGSIFNYETPERTGSLGFDNETFVEALWIQMWVVSGPDRQQYRC